MSGEISIRPSKDIRTNYAQIAAIAHQHPVAILYAHLAQAQDDIKLGRVQPMSSAVEDILRDIDKIEL